MKRRKPEAPPTAEERRLAGEAARLMRLAQIEPSIAGERTVAHILLARPRRGLWLATWSGLPGLSMDCGRRTYQHTLLPGWEYTAAEMRTEMIEDLECIARGGGRPKSASVTPDNAQAKMEFF